MSLYGTEYVEPSDFISETNVDIDREAVYRICFEHAPVALILVNGKTRLIEKWNPYATELFGWSEQEAIGRSLMLIIDPDIMSETEHDAFFDRYVAQGPKALERTFDRGRSIKGVKKNGSKPNIRIKVFPVFSGETLFIGAALEDISETVLAAAELKQANDQLAASKKALEKAYKGERSSNRKLNDENYHLQQANIKAETARSKAEFRLEQFNGRMRIIGWVTSVIAMMLILLPLLSLVNRVPGDISQLYRDALILLLGVLGQSVASFLGYQSDSKEGATMANRTTFIRRGVGPEDDVVRYADDDEFIDYSDDV